MTDPEPTPDEIGRAGSAALARALGSADPVLLDDAVAMLDRAVSRSEVGDLGLPARLSNLGAALRTRWERRGNPADLGAAHRALTRAVELGAGDPSMRRYLANLGAVEVSIARSTGSADDLDHAVETLEKARAATAEGDPERRDRSYNLGEALALRFRLRNTPADLDTAIGYYQEAQGEDPADRPHVALGLGSAHLNRYELTEAVSDLTEAVGLLGIAVLRTPDQDPRRPARLAQLGTALVQLGSRSGAAVPWHAAVATLREALDAIDETAPIWAGVATSLGSALRGRAERGVGPTTDADEAVRLLSLAVERTPPGHPERAMRRSNLVNALVTRGAGGGAAVDEHIRLLEDIVAEHGWDEPRRAMTLVALGGMLRTRGLRLQSEPDLERAVELTAEAVRGVANPTERGQYLAALAQARKTWAELTGSVAVARLAVESGREALALLPRDHGARAAVRAVLAEALRALAARTADGALVAEAVNEARAAVTATPAEHPARAGRVVLLAHTLHTQAKRLESVALLDEGIGVLHEQHDPTDLAILLLTRYDLIGDPTDLSCAVDTLRAAATGNDDDPAPQANLAVALHTLAELTGDSRVLDDAVRSARAALGSTTRGTRDHTQRLSNLGPILRSRFEYRRDVGDLDEAIEALQASVAETPSDHPDLPGRLSNLGELQRTRAEAHNDPADADAAVAVLRRAVAAAPDGDPDRSGILTNLGSALQTRARIAESRGIDGDRDRAAAVAAAQEAIDARPTTGAGRYRYLSNLGNALLAAGALDEAVATQQKALAAAPPTAAGRATVQANLATALERRHRETGSVADLHGALAATRSAATDATSTAEQRLVAAWAWADLAVRQSGKVASAADAVAVATDLAEIVVYGLGRGVGDRRSLRRFAGFASDAAAVAVAGGRPDVAVQSLEQSRGIGWHRLGSRTKVDRLYDAHPELAARLALVRRALDRPADDSA
ncbi:hypothetical protein [Actinomycetospora straminea]|uniref:Tetratricopeptide repeat protein n=1 Tax=Actinomycetospora straminea TaxID=663607 RepID=A0ABP9EIS3_9PSEU|nr:hypothetical protein [Actinomycetospora straminea]MDD7933756.1 hypothetical protein [Actinomycetospora straminea]